MNNISTSGGLDSSGFKLLILMFWSTKSFSPVCIIFIFSLADLKDKKISKNYQLNSSISVWRSLVFRIVGKFHWWSLYLKMLGKDLQLKTTTLLVFFLWLVKSLKNLWHLIYKRLLTEFGMLLLFTNLSLKEFQVWYLALFLLSVIDSFEWFWMESASEEYLVIYNFSSQRKT